MTTLLLLHVNTSIHLDKAFLDIQLSYILRTEKENRNITFIYRLQFKNLSAVILPYNLLKYGLSSFSWAFSLNHK